MPLKIREILQTTVGNQLLQFSLLMMTAHAITATLGLLEHPSPPMRRGPILPPSIWRLPIIQLLRKHANVELTHVKQGYYGAIAPKPTTIMVVAPPPQRKDMIRCLHSMKTTRTLPPPLRMQRTKTGFSTMPLKRYPKGLCTALAHMIHLGASTSPPLTSNADDIYETAEHFRAAYERIQEGGNDGHDYCKK